jgi:hypothetical protein
MFGLGKVFAAVANLVTSLTNLSATVDEINHGLRSQLYLDGPREATAEAISGALEHQSAESPAINGKPRQKDSKGRFLPQS